MKIVERMPTKKKKVERENWSWNGFVTGAVLGLPIYYFALGYENDNPIALIAIRILTLVAFLCGWLITVYNAYRRKALIDPFVDGLISGFGFSATVLDWYVHGIPLFTVFFR
jgi:hypothetical protein